MSDMRYDVWTYDDDLEGLRLHDQRDVCLITGITDMQAGNLAASLAKCYPHATFEIRTALGDVTGTFGAARGEKARAVPAVAKGRRPLGKRGQ